MQALGLIETRGLIAAIESADAMLKAAEVRLLEKTYVGGGLVTIAVTGDVGAVKAAVDAGAAAVGMIDKHLLLSQHVIPRPHEDIDNIMVSAIIIEEADEKTETEKIEELPQEIEVIAENPEPDRKKMFEEMFKASGLKKTIEALEALKVTELRNLAREYKDFGITGRAVSKADKKLLLSEFKAYYGRK